MIGARYGRLVFQQIIIIIIVVLSYRRISQLTMEWSSVATLYLQIVAVGGLPRTLNSRMFDGQNV